MWLLKKCLKENNEGPGFQKNSGSLEHHVHGVPEYFTETCKETKKKTIFVTWEGLNKFCKYYRPGIYSQFYQLENPSSSSSSNENIIISESNNELFELYKKYFTEEELKMYIFQLKLYVEYKDKNKCIIPLDDVYEYLGYSRIDKCKEYIKNNYIKNKD